MVLANSVVKRVRGLEDVNSPVGPM